MEADPVELTAAVFTVSCVLLTVRRSVWSWPVGIIGVVMYAYVFFDVKMYADLGLQCVFLVQSVWGWVKWSGSTGEGEYTIAPGHIEKLTLIHSVVIFIITYVFILLTLLRLTDASIPYVDSYLTTSSLLATWMLGRRYIENWYIWIQADIVYIISFLYKGMTVSAGLYFVLGMMAVGGLIEWNRSMTVKL